MTVTIKFDGPTAARIDRLLDLWEKSSDSSAEELTAKVLEVTSGLAKSTTSLQQSVDDNPKEK